MDESMPEGIETDSRDYWKWRARQWQRRCLRAEREKSELLALLNSRVSRASEIREERLAVIRGDSLGGRSDKPRGL